MKKTVLIYGFIAGFIFMMMVVSLVLMSGGSDFDKGSSLGYIFNVGALSMIFFAIRAFREKNGGAITFNKGFRVGLLVTIIGCVCYAVAWLVYIYLVDPDFTEKYAGYFVDKLKSSGKSAAEIESEVKAFKKNMADYSNPLTYSLYSFFEVFPGGLLVTILCALMMKREKQEVILPNGQNGSDQ